MVQFALTNEYATEILKLLRTEANLQKLQDEVFFTTLNYNPQLKAPGGCPDVHRPDHSDPRSAFVGRYAEWFRNPCLSNRSQRGLCMMGVRHIPLLTKRFEFFVNKFIYDFEPVGYDCLEWWLFRKVLDERESGHTANEFDPSFYENLYCSSNHL